MAGELMLLSLVAHKSTSSAENCQYYKQDHGSITDSPALSSLEVRLFGGFRRPTPLALPNPVPISLSYGRSPSGCFRLKNACGVVPRTVYDLI